MQTKSYAASFKAAKAADGTPTGEVEALVSVFGNVDLMGDRVIKGAFAQDIAAYTKAGDPLPMVWSHDWANPMSHIGAWDMSKAEETADGLLLKGTIDVGVGNPVADQVARLLVDRRVKEFSFAYDIRDEKTASDGANELLDLGIIEAGPTLKGANPETQLVIAKALVEAEAKAGRTLSSKNEGAIRVAYDALGTVLDSLGKPEPKAAGVKHGAEHCSHCNAPVDADGKYAAPEEPKAGAEEPEPITTEDIAAAELEAHEEAKARELKYLEQRLIAAALELP